MTWLSIVVAFFAGIVSFASPCCLPLVPVYVGYLVGTDEPDSPRARIVALRQGLAFVLGFTVVFVTLWASVGLVGYVLRDYASLLRTIGGAVLIVMGLHVAGVINLSVLYREVRVPAARVMGQPVRAENGTTITATTAPSYGRSTLLGVVFAAGWTPCVGPILGGIIGLASVSASVAQGTVLLLVFSLGLGLPFLLVAVGAAEVNHRLLWFRQHHAAVSLVTGALLVAVGFLMITNLFARLSGVLPAFGV
jgi:cytochrome c-type biogenesis protein